MLAPRIVTDEVSGLLQLRKLNQDSLNFNILQLPLHTGVDLGIGSVVPATAVKIICDSARFALFDISFTAVR
jgi:hypothetical protein